VGGDVRPARADPRILLLLSIAILFVGYVYVWKKGALEWD
jgi:NADH:ubiquinone oxidoreductase subunit 3 (subunit A)